MSHNLKQKLEGNEQIMQIFTMIIDVKIGTKKEMHSTYLFLHSTLYLVHYLVLFLDFNY